MKKAHWFKLAPPLALGLGLATLILVIPRGGLAQPVAAEQDNAGGHSVIATTGRAPFPPTSPVFRESAASASCMSILNVSGSRVETGNCYEENKTQTLCFTVYNGSTDAEWLDYVRLTVPHNPPAWTVSCTSQDATDSSGGPVNLTCSNSFSYEVLYIDNDTETPDSIGEISAGSSWGFCTVVTIPTGYTGDRLIHWEVQGDDDGSVPHSITGTLTIEQCTPLMLKPSELVVEGCNGVTQTHIFELWNNTGSGGTFDLEYNVPSGGAVFTGPSSFDMSAGDVVTFTVQLEPDRCLDEGEQVNATLRASGNGESDTSVITSTVTGLAGWQGQITSTVPTMDNVVVWASHQDGGLWSIGGYGSNGATQRYDPSAGTWSVHTPETVITPPIEYPMDGCYGLNGSGDEVVVLFPDTIVTGSLHIYNITHDSWYTEAIPAFYPPEGRWGQDIVSLLNNPSVKFGVEKNACYLSGGSTQTGGGRTRDLWVYYPGTNSGEYIDPFPASIWFGFHASWYVPWVGEKGAICVGGGIDHNSQTSMASSTQCYDLGTGTFMSLNDPLGPLPESWWGMADGWMMYKGRYQIWIANGVAQDGTLLPASAYADETTGGFVYGPDLPVGLYRLEGDGWNGKFYTEQGAAGGFNYSFYNQLLVQCPWCAEVYLPLVLR